MVFDISAATYRIPIEFILVATNKSMEIRVSGAYTCTVVPLSILE